MSNAVWLAPDRKRRREVTGITSIDRTSADRLWPRLASSKSCWRRSTAVLARGSTSIDRCVDPFAHPATLRYLPAPDGKGYKLWSIGMDRKDQGGQAAGKADVVLERKT
jgi:hypothetical protein